MRRLIFARLIFWWILFRGLLEILVYPRKFVSIKFWNSFIRGNKYAQSCYKQKSNSTKFHVWTKKSNNAKMIFYNYSLLLISQWIEIEYCNSNAKLTNKNWTRCISFKLAYVSMSLFQSHHFPLGNLKSLLKR